ncbi:glycoside hydrolase family 44 protein [Cohnella suwonensis]|uniref:Glycoside hydrolase family 44 protein n=1 Tax=Cohnella suwonensis TaxID=696072 RepID=A0ABW0M1D6_9BACL
MTIRKLALSRLLLVLVLCCSVVSSLFMTYARAEVTGEHVIFDDNLGEGFTDHSWAERSLKESGTVHAGSHSIRLNPSMDGALYLYSSEYFLTKNHNTLEFWIHGGSEGGQLLNVLFQLGGQTVAKVNLNDYLEDGSIPAGEWRQVRISLLPLKMPNGLFDGILLQDSKHANQGDVYVDDIRLVNESKPVPNIPPKPVVEQIVVYDDAMQSDFKNVSSNDVDLSVTSTVYSGQKAIGLEPGNGKFLYFYKDRVLNATEYLNLEFMIRGGGSGGQQLDLTFKAGGVDKKTIDLNSYVDGKSIVADWKKVSIPISELGIPDGILDGIVITGRENSAPGLVYIDDMVFTGKVYEQPKLAKISFPEPAMLMYAGNLETPVLTAYYDNGFTESVTTSVYWNSSAPNIVQADNGAISALATGESKVTAQYKGFTAELEVKAVEVEPETIFDDVLHEGYDDWSWAKRNLQESGTVHSGEKSIQFTPRWWQGVYFNREESLEVEQYYGFEFWIHGGSAGKQDIRFVVQDMNAILGSVVLSEILPEGIQSGAWQKVTVRLKDLGITEGYFNALVFQAWDEKEQSPVYIDDVKVLRYKDRVQNPKPPVTGVTVAINADVDRRPINPDIYGVNFEEIPPDNVSQLDKYPVVRWGGNSVTRYNWELNVQNHASDWFYMNLSKENAAGEQLPDGSRSDQFIDETLGDGGKVLLQVPTIGWTPKSREVTTGFSVKKYGPQQQTECSYGGWWCNPDAGNGIRPDGTLITNNDPQDTSKAIGPDFIARWIKHIQGRVGNKVNYYALDNEPMLWPYTHRDVHPNMTTYDEVWDYTKAYGAAIKEADPNGKIFGPVVWGWCAYFNSAADGCSPGPDSAAHGDKPFLEWYMEQVRSYEQEHGVRLIDYLDIHYYATESGVAISEDESKAVSARRLKSLKALYDPTFRDPSSWISEPVRLIPRMKEMLERTAPGTKLAITEYNFGNGRGISSGLAQAEALAIFGREGVDLATRWGQPLAGTPIEDAFKMYLDYDGKGGQIRGDSVRAVSSNVDMVGSYAVRGEDGTLYILLFNKDTAPKTASVSVAGLNIKHGDVYRFDAANRLGQAGTIVLEEGWSVELPFRSATLIVAKP